MSTQLDQQLNEAQACIYTRSNLRRAYADFDESEIAGIYMRGNACSVVRRDGSEQTYDAQLIKTAYTNYTCRLKDFFSYLGPNYRGPSIWHNNAYIMFKGGHYSHALGHLSQAAGLQRTWADKFIHLSDRARLIHLLQSDQTDLGHLVAPDGFQEGPSAINFDDAGSESEDEIGVFKKSAPQPYCSCGSFQRQLNNLSQFQAEIEGYKPSCIHLTWFQKYRDLLCKRTEIRNESPGATPSKCVAWWYAPPSDSVSDGRFVLLHTKSGAQAPLTHWRTYKPKETFTQKDAWDLFFNMMDAGYIPFPGTALPQLHSVIKK